MGSRCARLPGFKPRKYKVALEVRCTCADLTALIMTDGGQVRGRYPLTTSQIFIQSLSNQILTNHVILANKLKLIFMTVHVLQDLTNIAKARPSIGIYEPLLCMANVWIYTSC